MSLYDMKIIPDSGNFLYIIRPTDQFLPKGILIEKQPTLRQLQLGVGDEEGKGGFIELVPLFNFIYGRPCVAFCNEYGKIKNLPPNKFAQSLWEEATGRIIRDDHLVGNVVIFAADKKTLENM